MSPIFEARRKRHFMDVQDAIVVGAGPAGLTAAIYFGRYRRRCLVLEDDQSRARWIFDEP